MSAHPERRPDIDRCAERWRELLLAAGCDRAEVMPSAGNPLVYAEKFGRSGRSHRVGVCAL